MRRLVALFLPVLFAFAFFAATCDNGTSYPPGSGIDGLVTIGPVCPVERIDTPCADKPYQATLVIQDEQGLEVVRVQSGEDGRYRVDVAPGTYRLLPQWPNEGGPPTASEQQVEVRANAYTHVDVQYDSGIR